MSVPQEEVQESLADIMAGKEPPEVKEPVAKSDTETKGETVAKTEVVPPTKDEAKEQPAQKEPEAKKQRPDVAAIIDERRKRQALEREIAELKAGKPAERPSVFDNEDEAIRSRVKDETRSTREAIFSLSSELARTKHGDAYSEAEEAFLEASEQYPQLIEELRNSPNPGEFVYSQGIFHRKLSPHGGDVMKMLEHETSSLKSTVSERDTRIKALEAQVAELTQQKTDLESLPRSLNSKSSGASPKSGDDDDEDIRSITRFGNNKR